MFGLIILLFSCKRDNITRESPGAGNGMIEGFITDLNNSPVVQAIVKCGAVTTTTDASGKFTLTKVQFKLRFYSRESYQGWFF
jgi:hypothetical protein